MQSDSHSNPILSAGSFVALAFASASTASAQVTFSFDFHGPSRSDAACSGLVMSEGDILTPCPTGIPAMPLVPGPLPSPMISISAGAGGLGLPTYPGCVGTPPGVLCIGPNGPAGIEVDALSYGKDDLIDENVFGPADNAHEKAHYHFSVDDWATGFPVPIDPTVFSEGGATGDAAADIFTDIGFDIAPPLAPFMVPPGNIGIIDGNGRRSSSSLFAYRGVGLREPTAPGVPPDIGDNLDAFNIDENASPTGGGNFPVYFSLDASFLDPRTGFPNSGSAIANGFVGADVLVTPFPGAVPMVYAPAFALGLNLVATQHDSDDLDALILFDNGNGTFDPSFQPYDWNGPAADARDMLLFSVREGSAVIGAPDSIFGLPIQAGDILVPPVPTVFGGVSPFPGIFIACENLGLNAGPSRNGNVEFGDDLDALDFRRQKTLLGQEYCYGDGGLTAGCTDCPCGNNMPAGTQTGCRNGVGTGARLQASGQACVSNDTLRFEVRGANPNTFGILISGNNRLPVFGACLPGSGIAQPALLDGLRCIGGGVTRNGARATDANGDIGITNAGWGPPNGPPGGLIQARGLVACQTRQWQVFYREDPALQCGTGQNTTQGWQITIQP